MIHTYILCTSMKIFWNNTLDSAMPRRVPPPSHLAEDTFHMDNIVLQLTKRAGTEDNCISVFPDHSTVMDVIVYLYQME